MDGALWLSGPASQGVRGGLPAQNPGGVVEVELAQNRLGQAQTIDFPAALDGGGVLELLVGGLEVAPGGGEEALLVEIGRASCRERVSECV